MQNIITRRKFLDQAMKTGLAAAFASLFDIPLVMKQALAEGTIGQNGNKLLFIFLRGANDGLNTVIPAMDPAYAANRPQIYIPSDPSTAYDQTGPCETALSPTPTAPTYDYGYCLRSGNGFAALHPSLKFLAPIYNAGQLAIVDRVAYPKQSRSHFDSQAYWENGMPNNLVREGLFYRALLESGLTRTAALTGVSIQSALPISLRGSRAAMTNLADPTRFHLLGLPNTADGIAKATSSLKTSDTYPFPDKLNRELLNLQYKNMTDVMEVFASLNFTETGNTFLDNAPTNNDTEPYYLFPTTNAKNGGYAAHNNDASKYVVDTNAYGFFNSLKAAAIILNKTDAVIAGTEMGGFDTHNNQGGVTGTHANLQKRIGWALYALQKYFQNNADRCQWNNLVVITLSEFGRTTIQNSNLGTDHAEASVMFVAGGQVKGFTGTRSGVFGCHANDRYNGQALPWITGQTGSMFGANSRYLQRAIDYRSVLGEILRNHLGATAGQLNRIIPGYAVPGENLATGGTSQIDGVRISGELGLI